MASSIEGDSFTDSFSQGVTVSELIAILRRRYKLFCLVAISVTALVAVITLLKKPLYEGKFQLLIDSISTEAKPKTQVGLDQSSATSDSGEIDYTTTLTMLKSPGFLRVLDQDGLNYEPRNLKIDRLKDTKIIELSYRDTDPKHIYAVLSALSKASLDFNRNREQDKLEEAISYLEQQFPGVEENVNLLEGELEKLRKQYNIVDPSQQSEELVTQRNNQDQLLRANEADLAQQNSRYRSTQQQLKLTPNTSISAVSLSESTRYQQILNQLLDLDQKIALEQARVQPGSPTLLALQEKRSKLEPLLAEQARLMGRQQQVGDRSGQLTPFATDLAKQLVTSANDAEGLRRKQAALKVQREELQAKFERYPSLARQYQALQRKLEVAQKSLNSFLEARSKLRLQAAEKRPQWEVIDGPRVDSEPVSPKLPRNLLLGLILGCVTGVGACLLRDQADQVFHSSQEVEDDLKQPILATLPYVPDPSTLFAKRAGDNQEQYSSNQQQTFEAFKSLYTNLRFLGTEKSIKTLVIGSAIPGEGKSTVACLLAQTAVSMGQRVLLVDADLRIPQIHDRFNLNNVIGLTNILTGTTVLEQTIQRLDTGLSILTAGQAPPDPVRLLSSNCMVQLISDLQSSDEFDLVIFDGPMLLGLADTSSFSSQLDGLLLVISIGKVDRKAPKEVIRKLKFSNTPLLGVVTNVLDERHSKTERVYEGYRYARTTPGDSSFLSQV
jgi:capsular exopolysaccharide synthesis family protein